MHEPSFNPAMIRVVLIVLFLIISQVLRARKKSPGSPTPASGAGKASPLDLLRESMRQAAAEARARQSGQSVESEPHQVSDQFQAPPTMQQSPTIEQPSTVEPESSFIPSFLLLALLACLFLMAYRFLAR